MSGYIKLDGVIISKSNKDKVFDFLEVNGIEYYGQATEVTEQQLSDAVQQIVDSMNDSDLQKLKQLIMNHYEDDTAEFVEDFLIGNFGTGIFDEVFSKVLSLEMYELFDTYSNLNWLITDEFQSNLGNKVVNRLK